MSYALIAIRYLYSPSDEWVGPQDGNGPRPSFADSTDKKYTELCKPIDRDDIRYQVLTQCLASATNPKQELKSAASGMEKWLSFLRDVEMSYLVRHVAPEVPSVVEGVFTRILASEPNQDGVHHYQKISYDIEVGSNVTSRKTTRKGFRSVPGVTHCLDFQYGAAAPLGFEVTSKWTARDEMTGKDLRLEVMPSTDRKSANYRVWLEQPCAQEEPFSVSSTITVPDHDVDGFGCAGLVLHGFKNGVDAVDIVVTFETTPSMFVYSVGWRAIYACRRLLFEGSRTAPTVRYVSDAH